MNTLLASILLTTASSPNLKYHDKVVYKGKEYTITSHTRAKKCQQGLYALKLKSKTFVYVCGELLTKKENK